MAKEYISGSKETYKLINRLLNSQEFYDKLQKCGNPGARRSIAISEFHKFMKNISFQTTLSTLAGAVIEEIVQQEFLLSLQQVTKMDFGYCEHYISGNQGLIDATFDPEYESSEIYENAFRCRKTSHKVPCEGKTERCVIAEVIDEYRLGKTEGTIPPPLIPKARIVRDSPDLSKP